MKIYKIDDNKFKSIYISYNFFVQVKDVDIFSRYSVLGSLIAKSSRKYPTQKEIDAHLNMLYGTAYDVYIEKYGDVYRFEVRTDFINKKFLPGKEDLLPEVLEFIKEMLYNTTDWSDSMIERERESILERIREQKDDKLAYGAQRIEELMAEGEPYGCYLYGTEEVVSKVGSATVSNSYEELISSPVMVIVSGNLEGYEDIDKKIEEKFGEYVVKDVVPSELKLNISDGKVREFKEVKEYQETEQSVICLGYKIVDTDVSDYVALNVFNAILGVTPSSRLFMNVREKASLCYTIRSKYIPSKDMLVICGGINQADYEKAQKIIKEQVEDLQNGNITEEEFVIARDYFKYAIKEWDESRYNKAKCKMRGIVVCDDEEYGIETILKKADELTLEDIKRVAKKICLERVYLLGGNENE